MLKVRIGDSKALFQHAYAGALCLFLLALTVVAGNVAHLHILAADHLKPSSGAPGAAAGQVFFAVDDTEPEPFLDFMEPILKAKGYRAPPKSRMSVLRSLC